MPGLVELGSPHFVHTLVLGPAEAHRRPEPNVEVVEIFQSSYHFFGVESPTSPCQRCDQHFGVHVTLERYVVRLLPREVFGKRRFVIQNQRRVAIDRRHDLRHDDPICKPFAQEHQLIGLRGAAYERNAGVNHVWILIARLLDEFRRGPMGWDHIHRFYWEALSFELLGLELRDVRVYIHRIALVID